MGTTVALEHRTRYDFAGPVQLFPHVIRLRPAPHTRTPVEAYALSVLPAQHRLHWQQDPFGNHLARVVFAEPAAALEIVVELVADLGGVNPFDFLLEPGAQSWPFAYEPELAADLQPCLRLVDDDHDGVFARWRAALPAEVTRPQPTVAFLGALNAHVRRDVAYSVRLEHGVQTPAQTLTRRVGSCRDSAWLLVQALRHLGVAARFVSGYLVQLAPGAEIGSGLAQDVADLHAWAEAYLPGAGWVGLDPTSALFTGEGHLPLCAASRPAAAAPVTGATSPTTTTLTFSTSVRRLGVAPDVPGMSP